MLTINALKKSQIKINSRFVSEKEKATDFCPITYRKIKFNL